MVQKVGRASGRADVAWVVHFSSVAVSVVALVPRAPQTLWRNMVTKSVKTPGDPMARTVVLLLALVALTEQATMGCKNCIILGKEEKAMFRAHSDACLPVSHVDQRLVDAMLSGELIDEPPLRKHVYCVLLKCKLISKDGKLQKYAVLGKLSAKPDAKNATKVLESCAEQTGDTPEDLAWNLFRCGYDKKALLFEYMPTGAATDIDNTN